MSCGTCFSCDNCYGVCPDNAVLKLAAGRAVRDRQLELRQARRARTRSTSTTARAMRHLRPGMPASRQGANQGLWSPEPRSMSAVGFHRCPPRTRPACWSASGSTTCCRRSWRAATGCSARRCATARSSTTSSSRRRPAGGLDRRPGRRHLPAARARGRGLFGYAVGPRSWKQFLWPPRVRLWQARAEGDGLRGRAASRAHPRATRTSACARATCTRSRRSTAPARHPASRPRLRGPARERVHRRAQLLAGGRDVLLRLDGDRAARDFELRRRAHGGARGRAPLLPRRGRQRRGGGGRWPSWLARDAADDGELAAGERGGRAGASQARAARWTRPTSRSLLYRNYEHPRWDDVADRCLTCGNCTMVCPTCFCTTRRGRDRPDRRASAERRARVGLVLHDGLLLRARRQRALDAALALPPVDDAQARDLGRPVRHVRAASAAGAASRGARSRSTSPRRSPRSGRPTAAGRRRGRRTSDEGDGALIAEVAARSRAWRPRSSS